MNVTETNLLTLFCILRLWIVAVRECSQPPHPHDLVPVVLEICPGAVVAQLFMIHLFNNISEVFSWAWNGHGKMSCPSSIVLRTLERVLLRTIQVKNVSVRSQCNMDCCYSTVKLYKYSCIIINIIYCNISETQGNSKIVGINTYCNPCRDFPY